MVYYYYNNRRATRQADTRHGQGTAGARARALCLQGGRTRRQARWRECPARVSLGMASRTGSSLGVAQHDDDAVATQEHLAATGRGSGGRGGPTGWYQVKYPSLGITAQVPQLCPTFYLAIYAHIPSKHKKTLG